ncbi:MAG: endopeptidase La [Lachnospiraceae bacterium]|nr:endopeptidase La [Lachnospiraceae bacterium]
MIKKAVALRGICILPGVAVNFDVSRKKSIAAIESAMMDDQEIYAVAQRDIDEEEPELDDLYSVGVVASIKQIIRMPKGVIRVLAEGKYRAYIKEVISYEPYIEAEIEELACEGFKSEDEMQLAGRAGVLKDFMAEYAEVNPAISERSTENVMSIDDLNELIRIIPNEVQMSLEQRQTYLELNSAEEKFTFLADFFEYEIEINKIKKDIVAKVSAAVDKNQKNYYLREQLKAIHEELGDTDAMSDADEYEEKLSGLKAPKAVKDKIKKEIKRLRTVPDNSNEAVVERTYLDYMFDMPWNKRSKENKDLKQAKQVLEAAHYGLEKVKEKILDYLAVRTYSERSDIPILCLIGPPGTGKTSIAKSIAEALNRKYVRVCLGGMRDEAEIRGHRKTYIGAMPGRIANALKQAGAGNPLILLDEIDKTGSDYKGDVASALLEVLDGEQNKYFRDNFLEVPLDLSDVMFIATANDYYDIPTPLLDRMEVIDIESYTDIEKFNIAKKYLLPKQMEKCGLNSSVMSISDAAIMKVIHEYTREAGVRNLERRIRTICNKAVRNILEAGKDSVKITANNLEKYLGAKIRISHKVSDEPQVGMVTGLAWTRTGGETMEIEANIMPNEGKLKLTGQIGDVMQESAAVAYSFVKSILHEYDIRNEKFENNEIHIHVPEGAVRKDGPSAGIALATVMMSLAGDYKVKPYIAMTGEITIRGRVLAIGGLKEKLLGAKEAGVKQVIVPEDNRDDINELSEDVKSGLTIHFVKDAIEVFRLAFEEKPKEEPEEKQCADKPGEASEGEKPKEEPEKKQCADKPGEASEGEKPKEEPEEKQCANEPEEQAED